MQCRLLIISLPCFQAILFLQQLLDFQETAGAMLASQGTYMRGACLGMQFLPQIVWTSSLKRSNLNMHCELVLLLSFTLWFVLSSDLPWPRSWLSGELQGMQRVSLLTFYTCSYQVLLRWSLLLMCSVVSREDAFVV